MDTKLNSELKVNFIKFHKMAFLFNALDNGWTIKKKKKPIYFLKNMKGKKKYF